MEFKSLVDLITAIENHGFGIVLSAGLLSFLFYFGWRVLDVQVKKLEAKKLPAYNVRSHHIFVDLQRDLDYEVPRLALGTEGRTLLFKDMMDIKFRTFLDMIGPFIDQHKCEECKPECFYDKNLKFVTELVNAYEKKWRDIGIFEEAVNKFDEWHQPRVDMVVEGIRTIANNQIYQTREQKYVAILDLYYYAMRWALFDAELSLKALNGEITGKVYKGKAC